MIFRIPKEILEDYLPWKNQLQIFSHNLDILNSVFLVFEWSNKKTENFWEKVIENSQKYHKDLSSLKKWAKMEF